MMQQLSCAWVILLICYVVVCAESEELVSWESIYRPADCSVTAKTMDILAVHYTGTYRQLTLLTWAAIALEIWKCLLLLCLPYYPFSVNKRSISTLGYIAPGSTSGTEGSIFDTSRKRGREAIRFKLGAGEVVKGWDIGCVKMDLVVFLRTASALNL